MHFDDPLGCNFRSFFRRFPFHSSTVFFHRFAIESFNIDITSGTSLAHARRQIPIHNTNALRAVRTIGFVHIKLSSCLSLDAFTRFHFQWKRWHLPFATTTVIGVVVVAFQWPMPNRVVYTPVQCIHSTLYRYIAYVNQIDILFVLRSMLLIESTSLYSDGISHSAEKVDVFVQSVHSTYKHNTNTVSYQHSTFHVCTNDDYDNDANVKVAVKKISTISQWRIEIHLVPLSLNSIMIWRWIRLTVCSAYTSSSICSKVNDSRMMPAASKSKLSACVCAWHNVYL